MNFSFSALSIDLDGCLHPYRTFVYDTPPQTTVGLPCPDLQNVAQRQNSQPAAGAPAPAAPSAAGSQSSHRQPDPGPLIAGRLATQSEASSILTGHEISQGANHRLIDIFEHSGVRTFLP